jgi:serine/threonine protein kinase
MEYCENGDMA